MQPVVITVGEPDGIGPDIMIKLAAGHHQFDAPIVFIANGELLLARADKIGEQLLLPGYDPQQDFSLIDIPLNNNAEFVLSALKAAVQGCCDKKFSAMVTAPVNKARLKAAGLDFLGHTEYLASLTGSPESLMLFIYGDIRLALLTTHIPLSDVSAAITAEKIISKMKILHLSLIQRFNIKQPKLLVTGLNPHAGEQGYLGKEEQVIITPALNKLRDQGLAIIGPVAADTAFETAKKFKADAILSLYHDQLLPVIKTLGFGEVVNVTLGLPIIRTSVDHGTAIELAGTGKADESSLVSATRLAIKLAQNG